MRIAVCVKQVPSTNKVRMDPVTNTIIRDAKQSVINPYDLFAAEMAVTLKERFGAHITAVSMGIPAVEKLLRDCIARGCDEAVLFSDRAFAGADTLATSYTLKKGLESLGDFDLILCGRMAIDGDTAQTGPALAEVFGIPHVSAVTEVLSIDEKTAVVSRVFDGAAETLEVSLPALFTVQKDINVPRMPSIAGMRKSLENGFSVKNAADISADTAHTGLAGSPTQVVRTFVPVSAKTAETVEGSAAEKAERIIRIVAEAQV